MLRTCFAALVAAALVAACGDSNDTKPSDGDDDPLPGALAPCVDQPDQLSASPSGQLPCDLLPPGFTP